MNFPWLTVLAALPLLGAIALAMLPGTRADFAKQLAFAVSLVTLGLSVAMAVRFVPRWRVPVQRGGQLDSRVRRALRARRGRDRAGPRAAHHDPHPSGDPRLLDDADGGRWSPKTFFAWVLALEGLAIGVFAATDVFLFYVLFEATLIPIYFLIGGFGGPQRSYAAMKFLLYSLFGGLLMLASVIGLYVVSSRTPGGPTYLLSDLMEMPIDEATGRWLFLGFFAAFAIKAPMWPLHTWLPDAASAGTPGTSVLLVSVLDKIGTFGMIRFCLGLFPEASRWATPVVIVLAVFSISTARCSPSARTTSAASSPTHRSRTSASSCSASSCSPARASPARRCTCSTTASRPRRCSW
jgi:NADH-quinone oxidoreductase subunit M